MQSSVCFEAHQEVHMLYGLARCAFEEVIDGAKDRQSLGSLVKNRPDGGEVTPYNIPEAGEAIG